MLHHCVHLGAQYGFDVNAAQLRAYPSNQPATTLQSIVSWIHPAFNSRPSVQGTQTTMQLARLSMSVGAQRKQIPEAGGSNASGSSAVFAPWKPDATQAVCSILAENYV